MHYNVKEIQPVEANAPSTSAPIGFVATDRLFQELTQRGVRYCHWKSNIRLEKSLNGRTDLDLLVDRKHSALFKQTLYEHKLKAVLSAPGKRYPAMESYLGFDPDSGEMYHLHVHYQLVLGERFVKNYRLPLEAWFLDMVQVQHNIKIPLPELEIAVMAIRALLKYRDRDVIKDVFSILSPGLQDDIVEEINYLLSQTTMEQISAALTRLSDVIPGDIVLEFLQTVVNERRAGYKFYKLRQRLRQALRPYRRHTRLQANLKYIYEMWRRRKRFKFSRSPKMTLLNGGITIALIGPDGAGKSTLREILFKWLNWKLDVRSYYLGSTQASDRSNLLYYIFRIFRRGHTETSRIIGDKNIITGVLSALRDNILYLHYLSIGYDRYHSYWAGRKRTMAGYIALYDRHPLETISKHITQPLMDGPQIHLLGGGEMGTTGAFFSKIETRLYQKIRPPDLLCVLDVSPNVSLQRKPDHNRAAIEKKSRAVKQFILLAEEGDIKINLLYVNADKPFEEVLAQLKKGIWENL